IFISRAIMSSNSSGKFNSDALMRFLRKYICSFEASVMNFIEFSSNFFIIYLLLIFSKGLFIISFFILQFYFFYYFLVIFFLYFTSSLLFLRKLWFICTVTI